MNVLIVEDEDRIAAFVERGLKAEGFTVQRAADGVTGYALACQDEVDLVILDLMLPGAAAASRCSSGSAPSDPTSPSSC